MDLSSSFQTLFSTFQLYVVLDSSRTWILGNVSLANLVKLFETGTLQLPEITTMPFERAADAHRQSESGTTRGKVVLEIQSL